MRDSFGHRDASRPVRSQSPRCSRMPSMIEGKFKLAVKGAARCNVPGTHQRNDMVLRLQQSTSTESPTTSDRRQPCLGLRVSMDTCRRSFEPTGTTIRPEYGTRHRCPKSPRKRPASFPSELDQRLRHGCDRRLHQIRPSPHRRQLGQRPGDRRANPFGPPGKNLRRPEAGKLCTTGGSDEGAEVKRRFAVRTLRSFVSNLNFQL